jgi:hypothetical protein
VGSNRIPSRQLDDHFGSFEHLLAAGEAARQLLDHPGWEAVQGFVKAEIDSALTGLDRGGEPPSQAEYARAHGRRAGLLYAQGVAEAIVARADQRYEEQQRKHEGAAETAPEGAMA